MKNIFVASLHHHYIPQITTGEVYLTSFEMLLRFVMQYRTLHCINAKHDE